ncbi:hypothetical protein F4821DRAFT_220444 [Hypoxylon rubiginosum]|uniref:Uncharacterized protein n=1 Tax=Hypoxylon rubiginosum TaxID=110542 RepID=A0ACC0CP03_9PEZI|nr:hypothetical protein F4821DRAFT_220444 [Hypoxylon rubiginosum]
MPYLWGPARALRLAAVLAATVSASFIRPSALLSRADETCAADNFTRCTQSGLPDNFCCETGSTCLVLAGATTILCCPDGSTCAKISAITCDITLQDASSNPAAEIKTTALDSELAKCGDQCCPFGYRCDGTICVKEDDQSQKPAPKSTGTSTPASTPTPTPTPTADPTASATVSVSGITTAAPSTTETPAPSTESTSNTVKVVGGVIGGVVGLVLIVVAVIVCRFKRRKQQREQQQAAGQNHQLRRHNSSTSSFGNIIGEPKPHPIYANDRIDFLAKQSSETGSMASSPYGHLQRPHTPQTPRQQGDERDFGFMPPNSPYSPYSRRPDSTISDAPRSYHQSAEIGGLAGLRSLTNWKPNHQKTAAEDYLSVRLTPPASASRDRERRQPSGGSESINIFADPVTFGGRPTSTATTWSNIQQRADRNTVVPPPPRRT